MNKAADTPIWQLTISEFQEVVRSSFNETKEDVVVSKLPDKKVVYGIGGLAKLLNCSTRHASSIKNSGRIDDAIIENGRKPIFDMDKVLTLLQRTKSY